MAKDRNFELLLKSQVYRTFRNANFYLSRKNVAILHGGARIAKKTNKKGKALISQSFPCL